MTVACTLAVALKIIGQWYRTEIDEVANTGIELEQLVQQIQDKP